MENNFIDGRDLQRAYDLFWLWVLGVYELVRTMVHYKEKLSDDLRHKAEIEKRALATLRMPFAKHQLKGTNIPIYGELSVYDIDNGLVFEIRGKKFHSSEVIDEFIDFIEGIKPSGHLRKARSYGR